MAISGKTGVHPSIVRRCISLFLKYSVFDKANKGFKYSIRGVGKFNPWKSTVNRRKKGKKLIVYNANAREVGYFNRAKKKALNRKNNKPKVIPDTGWE